MGSTHRPLLATVLATALAATGVAGCGSASQDDGSALVYWATNESATVKRDEQIYNKIVADFEKMHGVNVKITVVPWTDLYKKILTATTSGQGPDVVNIGNTWSASLQATGAFVEFDEETMAKIGGREKFVSSALKSSGAPGQTPAALPLYLLPDPVLFYNKEIFDRAGVKEPPKTWEEFATTARKLTKDTDGDGKPDQWGFAFPGTDWYTMVHRTYVMSKQAGGQFFNAQGKPTFATPENVQAVTRIVNRVQQDMAPPAVAEYQGTDALSDFVNGKAAMVMRPLNSLAALKDRGMKPSEFGIAMRPVPATIPPGGQPYRSYLSGTNISIFSSTDNKELAVKFTGYMTSKKQQIELAKAYGDGYLPVIDKSFESEAYGGDYRKLGTRVIKHAVAMPQVPQEADMENFVGNAVVKLVRQAAAGQKVTSGDIRTALQNAGQKMRVG